MDFGLVSVTHLPRNAFKGSRVQTCVLKMDRRHNGDTKFKCIEQKGTSYKTIDRIGIMQ